MDNKNYELFDEDLDAVSAGQITYTWDGTSGTIGINGYNPFILVDKDGFVEYFKSTEGKLKDSEVLNYLVAKGIIKKP